MAIHAISLTRTCSTRLVATAITIKNIIVTLALRSLQFLHACYIHAAYHLGVASAQVASDQYISLPDPSTLIRSDDGKTRVIFLCHKSFTIFEHYKSLSPALEQRYGKDCDYREIIDPADRMTTDKGQALLANTPNLFLLSEGVNAIINECADGQYATSGYLAYWKTQYETEEKKSAHLYVVDPLPVGDPPSYRRLSCLGRNWEEHQDHIKVTRLYWR